MPNEPFLINRIVGVLKPLGKSSTIFALSLNMVRRLTLFKFRIACRDSNPAMLYHAQMLTASHQSFAVNVTKFGDPSFNNNYQVMEIAFVQMNL